VEQYFLSTTKGAAERLTSVFDFVWPTATAIWNLRWEVTGFLAAVPEATPAALSARFVSGSGIYGANLRRACVEMTWEQQQQEFARFLLVELCALYEGWCEGALAEIGVPQAAADRLRKQMQFPTQLKDGVARKGVGFAIASLCTPTSPALSTSLTPVLRQHAKYSLGNIDSLLMAYRYFKELRNSLIHSGTSVTPAFTNAEAAYDALSSADLGLGERPEHCPAIPAIRPSVSLRGVVGFGEVVLRMICTLDAEISASARCETVVARRWREVHGANAVHVPQAHITRRSRALVRQLGVPSPAASAQLEGWLIAEGMII
jgi:hypothetical protein